MEMSQAPEQDLPRAKITDTGQEKIEEVLTNSILTKFRNNNLLLHFARGANNLNWDLKTNI
jgi:hypothetical protein